MSNFYTNYIQNLGSQKCCNIKTQGYIGPQGPNGKEYIGPRGNTGPSGISYTGPTGRGCRGPTGPLGISSSNIIGLNEPFITYLLTEDFHEITNYLKINLDGNEKWIPLISKDPYLNFESPLYNYPINNSDFDLTNGTVNIRWNEVSNSVGYKIFYTINNKGSQYLINNFSGPPCDKYRRTSIYTEIDIGNVLNYNITLSLGSRYNIFIYAYDSSGNRSETPTTQLYLKYSGSEITYTIWPVYIYEFGNGATNMQDIIDNPNNMSVNVLNNYNKITTGILNFSTIYDNNISFSNFPQENIPPLNYVPTLSPPNSIYNITIS